MSAPKTRTLSVADAEARAANASRGMAAAIAEVQALRRNVLNVADAYPAGSPTRERMEECVRISRARYRA